MEKGYLSPGKIAKLLGVHVNTLRRWERSGKLMCEFRTIGNHRRYDISSVVALFSKKEEKNLIQ